MWIERPDKKTKFVNELLKLSSQVLIVRGARQVGKTSFVLDALKGLSDHPQLKLNLLYPSTFKLGGVEYLGRDFFGKSDTGEDFLKNIEAWLGNLARLEIPAIVFVDEVDRFPPAMEAIQTLASFSDKLKFIFTGSNLENLAVKNAATGRKRNFDLHPITFREFLNAGGYDKLLSHLNSYALGQGKTSEFLHGQLNDLLKIYIRIGGMPRILDAHMDPKPGDAPIPEIAKDLAFSIEENVKTVLGEKSKLYEYEDVLRKMAYLSMNTLKFTNLQVQHAGRSEAKKLVAKTVGARVAHKIRLFEAETDLSKYIIFDCGIANYLLNGSDLLRSTINDRNMAMLFETFVGTELIANLVDREDLFYWKSGNRAEVEFLIKSPFVGIDVKTTGGDVKSLNSFAICEPGASCIVKVSRDIPMIEREHVASLPSDTRKRTVPLITIPHYLTCRLRELVEDISGGLP